MRRLFALALALAIAPCALAGLFSRKAVKLSVNHTAGLLEARTLGNQVIDSSSLGGEEPLEVRSSETVQIWIDDPNPIVFTYEFQGVKLDKNADYEVAVGFAKSISDLIANGLPKAAEIRAQRAVVVGKRQQKTDPDETFVTDLATLTDFVGSITDKTKQSLGTKDDIKQLKDEVSGFDVEEIDANMKKYFTGVDERIAAWANAETGAATTENAAATARADASATDETRAQLRQDAAAAKAVATAAKAAATQPVPLAAKALESKINAMIAAAHAFKDAVAALDVPVKLGEVPYNFKQDSTAQIRISAVKGQETVAKESHRATGDFNIPVRAYFPAHYTLGAAAVYSFVKAPTFTTKKREDNQFDIVETDEKVRALTVAAMLSITPRWCAEPTFGCDFQLGVSPVKDQIGVFAGAQIRLTDALGIGFGYGYQQVPRLAKGLSLTAPIASPDDLKTDLHYKGGLYFSFNLNLPK